MATYLYGIVRPDASPPRVDGVDGAQPRLLECDGLAALVGDVETGSGEFAVSARGLKAHARVLEAVAAHHTVLPLRFGSVLSSDDEVIEKVLRPRAVEFGELLERFAGLVEVRVRIMDDDEVLLREVAERDQTVLALQRKVARVGPAAGHYDRIRLGQRIADLLRDRHAREAEEVLGALRPVAVDTRMQEASLDRVVVDLSLLVERARLPEVDAAVEEIARARPALTVRYLGPDPPYTFTAVEG